MTNTKELLELAALAAGYSVEFDYYGEGRHAKSTGVVGMPPETWNPLANDGDAFRLSVNLTIRIEHNKDAIYGDFSAATGQPAHWKERIMEWWDKNESPESAARRAIVRCAAQIGRKMKESA